MEDYLAYHGKKYIMPEKAGARKKEMEIFKKDGQSARAQFQALSKQLASQLEEFQMQKVSGWMNQAQIGRPHFWCYFQHEADTRVDPTFAIRLLTIDGRLGISVEVSFIERGVLPETVARQNQILTVPIQEPLYYLVQADGVSHREPASETVRLALQEKVAEGSVRKVLVKYDIPNLTGFPSDQALIAELLQGFKLLFPYYQATKKELSP